MASNRSSPAPSDDDRSLALPIPNKIRDSVDRATWGKIGDFDPSDPSHTPTQIGSVIGFLVEHYREQQFYGRALWSELLSDFEDWPEETFTKAPSLLTKYLRDFMVNQGVFVPTNGERIAKNVHEVMTRARFRTWSEHEILQHCEKNKQFNDNAANPEFIKDICDGITAPKIHISSVSGTDGGPFVNPNTYGTPEPPANTFPDGTSGWQRRPQPASSTPAEMPSPRQLTDLTKLYSDEMKYSGEMYDVLEAKLLIFRDNCHKAGIPHAQFAGAFSIMLKGKALRYYFDRLCEANRDLDFHTLVARVKNHFETEESRQAYLAAWRNTTLPRVIHENPEKSHLECLDILLDRLTTIQRALSIIHQSDEALRDQLLNACRGVKECELCLFSPAPTYEGVCNQLRSAIGTATRSTNQQFWTDRTYQGQGRQARFGRGPPRTNGFKRQPNPSTALPATPKKCYVCGKEGCWSTKHPVEDRRRAYDGFRAKYKHLQDTSPPAFNHFLAWHEGLEEIQEGTSSRSTSNSPISQYFQALEIPEDTLQDTQETDDEGDPWQAQQFHASYFTTPVNGPKIVAELADQATRHALTKEDPQIQQHEETTPESPREQASAFTFDGRYSAGDFQGIIPDTGAATVSTAGKPQFLALQRRMPIFLQTAEAGTASIRFGRGDPVVSLGSTLVPTPFGDIAFHVVPADTPFLLCLADMDRLGIQFDNIRNVVARGKLAIPVVRKWGHPWILLHPEKLLANSHLTEVELRRLHRRFGHPTVQRLHLLLRRAGHPIEVEAIERLTAICRHCQLHAGRPARFKFTIQDDHEFNYEVIVDIMYLDGNKPVLHVVDSATAFNAARFLQNISAKHTWDTLRLCWIDVYQGPPDWIVTDAGTNFHSVEFKQAASSMAISIKEVPIEAHNSVGKVERYHAPLRRAYNIIRAEDPSTAPEIALQMAVKSLNDTAGPNGLVPTLLVFGAYPRITQDSAPSPATSQRAEAIRKAMADLRQLYAKRRVAEALTARNGPDTMSTLALPLQSLVRVWREKQGWQGPYRLLSIDGTACTIDMPQGPKRFRSTVIRPFHEDPADTPLPQDQAPPRPPAPPGPQAPRDPETIEPEIVVAVTPEPEISAPKRGRGRPRKNPIAKLASAYILETDVKIPQTYVAYVFLSGKERADYALAIELRKEGILTAPGEPFEASTKKEIDALIGRGVFEFTRFKPDLHQGRIFKSRIVNEVKGKATDAPYEKSRLVIQGYADDGKEVILTQAPTIQRASQRLILAITPSLLRDGKTLWLRDITQAYVQSETPLNRTILARLPKQIEPDHPPDTIMKVIKPLYGIAEAGTHWWATYSRHHRERLQMETSTYDPCLLISTAENEDFACVGMQTDDTLGLSDAEFSIREDKELADAAFTAKPKQLLGVSSPLIFNGGIVSLTEDGILTLRQKDQGKKIDLIDVNAEENEAKRQYVEQRARGAYIASICQPEACFDLSTAAQHQEPSPEDIKVLNKRLQWQMESLDRGLNYRPLDLATAKLFVFVDGSFANNDDLTSQLGFVIVLANEQQEDEEFNIQGNIVHYSSTKSKRVTRSVLASEVYGMVAGADMAYAIASTLQMITDRLNLPKIPMILCTDSYSLYECLVKLGTTKEKRLMIDIMALRQSYERREVYEIRWIHGDDNLADAFTKATPNRAFERFVDTAAAKIRMEGWVTRA